MAEIRVPEPLRRSQCFAQKALGLGDKSALQGDWPNMLRTHQADLAQANPDLSVEASEPRKAAAQLVSLLRSTASMQLIQNQSYMSY